MDSATYRTGRNENKLYAGRVKTVFNKNNKVQLKAQEKSVTISIFLLQTAINWLNCIFYSDGHLTLLSSEDSL